LLWFYDARWARRIRQLAAEAGPFDVIHVHDLPLVKTARVVGRRMGARVVADMHENYPMVLPFYRSGKSISAVRRFMIDPRRWEKYERKCVPLCSATIAVTDQMKARLVSIGVDPERVSVVENLVDTERFLSYPLDSTLEEELRGSYVITYVGGFLSNRGLDTTLRAMPKVISDIPEALLMLVGDGTARIELEELSSELGLEGHVRFEGWVDFDRIPGYLAASDVCILPLIRSVQTDAALSHKLFQYMLMGKPVVASSCVEMRRVVEEADCGLLFPPGDSDALAEALIRLTDAELRARFGGNGRAAIHDRYSWSHAASRLLQVYEELDSVRGGAATPSRA
jgi:glycosyltransferase involved in cell wall biosynthesis